MRKVATENTLMACMAAILLVMAMLGVVSYSVLSRVNRAFEVAVNSTARKLQLAGDINMDASDMLAAQRGVSVYANTAEANMQRFDLRSAQIDRSVAEMKSLSMNPEELKIIGIVETSNVSYRETVHQAAELHTIRPDELSKVANAYKTIDESTDQLEVLESNGLREGLSGTQSRLRYGRIILRVCMGIALLVVLFALHSIRVMGKALRASAERLRASNDLFRSISDSMPCAVCIFDLKGDLKRWNKNFLGYTFEELRETGVLAAVESDSLEAVKLALAKTMETGYGELEAYLRNKAGERVPTYLSHRRFEFEGELCILGVAVDTSRQKKVEQYSQLQRVALESASEGIVITDATGTIEWANPAFTTLTGYELDEVRGT